MTMRYLKITLPDVQREFYLARSQPRHLAPQPKSPAATVGADLPGLLESLRTSQHVLEMFRRTLLDGRARRCLDRLANRLTKIVAEALKLASRGATCSGAESLSPLIHRRPLWAAKFAGSGHLR
jgi:hypothetical protein